MSFLQFSGHFSGSQLSDEFIDLDVANQSPYEEEKYAENFSFLEKTTSSYVDCWSHLLKLRPASNIHGKQRKCLLFYFLYFFAFFPFHKFSNLTFANALRNQGSDWLSAHRKENSPYHLVTRNFTQSFEIFNSQIFTNGVNTSFTKQVRGTKMTKLTASKTHYFLWAFVHGFNIGSRRWNWKFREKTFLKSETRTSVTFKL